MAMTVTYLGVNFIVPFICLGITASEISPVIANSVAVSDDCYPTCLNGGLCFKNTTSNLTECSCPSNFSGLRCEVENYCAEYPCPQSAVDCILTNSTRLGRVCICPVGVKGDNCTIEDPPIRCQNANKTSYFEKNPAAPVVCLNKTDTNDADVCVNPNEDIVYQFPENNSMFIFEDLSDKLCVTYILSTRNLSYICFDITAFEVDDIQFRPWINATSKICFIFNNSPTFTGPNTFIYDIGKKPQSDHVSLQASDIDKHQNLTFIIVGVKPVESTGMFSINESKLVVQLPINMSQVSTNTSVTVTIQVSDDGIPELTSFGDVIVQFVNVTLTCTAKRVFVHTLSPPKSSTPIGQINCVTNSPKQVVTYVLLGSLAPISIDTSGSIFYVHDVVTNESDRGIFTSTVYASVNDTVYVVNEVRVVLIVDDLRPNCSEIVPDPWIITEKIDVGTCSEPLFLCSDPANFTKTCNDSSDTFDVNCTDLEETQKTSLKLCTHDSLDRQIRNFTVYATVSNKYGFFNISKQVVVQNINDPPHILHYGSKMEYISVWENESISFALGIFPVDDIDVNNTPPLDSLLVNLTDLDNSGIPLPFSASLNDIQNAVTVILVESLQTDVRHRFIVELKVTDSGGLFDTLILNISVLDVNQPPSCSVSSINTEASVLSLPETIVTSLNCTDPDFDINFKSIVYNLNGTSDITSFFSVDDQGVVRIKHQLSNFTQPGTFLQFTIIVQDGGGSFTTVELNITIKNSYPPVCNTSNLVQYNISEKTNPNTCFSTNVTCSDQVIKSTTLTFRYNGTTRFKLNEMESKNNLAVICTNESLQNGYGNVSNITITVGSPYGQTNLFLEVTVYDVNDPPVFANSSYVINVNETVPNASVILTVVAADPDGGVLGMVTYYCSDNFFAVDKVTGNIQTISNLDADRNQTHHVFVVKAVDGAPQALTATTTVTVNILDVNDEVPICAAPTVPVNISLLSSVGTVVYRLQCFDSDITPNYSRILYSLKSPSSNFIVNETGYILLVSTLQRNATQFNLAVQAMDADNNLFSSAVVVSVNIANNIPPTCMPSYINVSLSEDKAIGECLDKEVICEDPTNGSLEVNSTSGSAKSLLVIRTHVTSYTLKLSACVNTTLRSYSGQAYQLNVIVSNGLATTMLNWTMFVENVNNPPVFNPAFYNVSVMENDSISTSSTLLVTLNVSDPDDGRGTKQYELANITAELVNNNGELANAIKFLNRSFFAVSPTNATVRNLYSFIAIAKDGLGLSATATVLINILDVNSSPWCTVYTISRAINISTSIGTEVFVLPCYDSDRDPLNKQLMYAIMSGDQDGYFNITANGMVSVAKQFPRAPLYNTSIALLQISVRDYGSPTYSVTVAANITVDYRIPATCSPVVIPPKIWVINACVNITMSCTDPTTNSTDHLVYQTSGNYTLGFIVSSNNSREIVLCYNQTISGNFEINIRVDNGLSSFNYTTIIIVSYEQATPTFSMSWYYFSINESVPPNSVIGMVNASSQHLIGTISYVVGTETSNKWTSYFALNSTSGQISTVKEAKDLANQFMIAKIEAVDTGSKLTSMAIVNITVLDVNESPTCNVTVIYALLDMDTQINTRIANFTCKDPDIKAEYTVLHYSLSGEQVNTYFDIFTNHADASSYIFVKLPLNVTQDMYYVILTVTDGGSMPFTKTVNLSVNLLPPPLQLVALALKFDIIKLSWTYARQEFYNTTNSYVVFLKELGESTIIYINKPEIRSLNVTGLKPNTTYTVIIQANTAYGDRNSSSHVVRTPEFPELSNITATLRVLSIDFTDLLRNTSSQQYYIAKEMVTSNIDLVLKKTAGYAGIELKGFRPANSVFVDISIAVNQSGSVESTLQILNYTVSTGWLQNLSVDSSYFVAYIGDVYILVQNLSVPSEIYVGSVVELVCNIITVGYLPSENLDVWWTYQGVRLNPTSLSRFNIATKGNPNIPEYKQSVLRISDILTEMSGSYGCHASDGQQEHNKNIEVNIIPQPVVVVVPTSVSVKPDETVTIVCELVTSLTTFKKFVWYKNGITFSAAPNEIFSKDGAKMTLTIVNISQTTVYGCEGDGMAGTGPKVLSYIGVILPDSRMCPLNVDQWNKSWPVTAPGIVFTLPCQTGFRGNIYRTCDTTGLWRSPVYDCIRDQLLDIENQINSVKDGSSTKNLSMVLGELAVVTNDTDLYISEITTTINALNTATIVTNITNNNNNTDVNAEAENFLQIASNLIDDRNKPAWFSRIAEKQKGAIDIPKLVESYIGTKVNQLATNGSQAISRAFIVKNIYAEIGQGKRESYQFPDLSNSPLWINSTKTGISIPGKSFENLSTIHFASSFYRNIVPILVKTLKQNGVITDITDMMDINSDIVAFKVKEVTANIEPPAEIVFQHFDNNYSNPICCYWDFEESTFITDGCHLVSTSSNTTVCSCNHFTNFAVLMSPGRTPVADEMVLSIISAIGCGISIFCLLLTVIIYSLVWRYVKGDRVILLMNLCFVLIAAYALFLGGVDATKNKTTCTIIAVLLHYIYLVVFFIMLAYGIEIAISVIYVFVTRSRIKWLLPLAWGVPLIIVGISMGVTKLDGYGNEKYCWLSIDGGLIWAFVGPAGLVILINYFIVITVLRKMFKSSAMLTKSDKKKAKTGIRSIFVLLPILGLTWIFGILSVNESLVAFQYIFAICNSLQGGMIFIFHCLLNSQIREALKQRHRKRKSIASFESTYKNQHSTSGTAFYGEKKSNIAAEVPTSNPFLEADRQMKELVAKNKTGSNIYDINITNNKVDIDKLNKVVELEDVKISNIQEKSEIMTTGLHSSTFKDTTDGNTDMKPKEVDNLCVSKESNSSYDYIDLFNSDTARYQTVFQKPPGYSKILGINQTTSSSQENVHSNSHDIRMKEKHQQHEIEKDNERQKEIQFELLNRKTNERKKYEHDKHEKEREERNKIESERDNNVVKIKHVYEELASRNVDINVYDNDNRAPSKKNRPERTSRSDDDYEPELIKAKRDSKSKKKQKDERKPSLKDRPKAYVYSYETTYLGEPSRHASLENMNAHRYFGPYGQMHVTSDLFGTQPTNLQHNWDQKYPYRQEFC